MNIVSITRKNWIQTLALCFLAAVTLSVTGGCIGCEDRHEPKEAKDSAYEEWLRYPRPLPKGNSRAFSVEPVEGITISAKENAMDKDRTFEMKELTERQWNEADKAVETLGAMMLAAWDLDAGMTQEEVLPGTYKVSFDLAKMGIPAAIEQGLVAYRIVDGVPVRYNTTLENHIMTYESSQNSVMAIAVDQMKLAVSAFKEKFPDVALYVPNLLWNASKRFFTKAFSPRRYAYFMQGEYTLAIPIEDPYGNFVLNVRLEDTEMSPADCRKHFQLEKDYIALADKLQLQAETEVEQKVQKYVADRQQGSTDSWLVKWIKGRQLREEALRRVSLSETFARLYAENKEMEKILKDPAMAMPKSVEKVIEYVRDANQYLTKVEKLKPATYESVINLVTTKAVSLLPDYFAHVIGAGCSAITDYYPQPTVTFNGELLYEKGKFSDTPHYAQSVRITLTHELFHARQTQYWTLTLLRDNKYAEATAAVLEQDAARYFYKNGRKMSVNPAKGQGHGKYRWADRGEKNYYATGLEGSGYSKNPPAEGTKVFYGYALADFIEYLRVAKKKQVPVAVMMNNCKEAGFVKPVCKSFGIKTYAALDSLYTNFLIEPDQRQDIYGKFDSNSSADYRTDQMKYVISEDNCLIHITPKSNDDYHVEAYAFDCNNTRARFNAFVVGDEAGVNPAYRLYLWETGSKKKAQSVYAKDIEAYMSGFGVGTQMSKNKSAAGYYVGIMFKPGKPALVNVRGDTMRVRLDDPQQRLVEKGLLTGARITLADEKGQKTTFDIPLGNLGKTHILVKKGMSKQGGNMKLSFHWYCNASKDGKKRFLSPESDAVAFHVEKQKEAPKVKPEKSEGSGGEDYERGLITDEIRDKHTGNGSGYWKLTQVRLDKPRVRSEDSYGYNEWDGARGSYHYKSVWTADTWRDVSIDGHRNCKGETGSNTVEANMPKSQYFAGDKMEFKVNWTLSDNSFHPGMTVPYGIGYSCWMNNRTRVRIDPTEASKNYISHEALRGKGPNGGWPTSGHGVLQSTPLPEGHRGDSLILTESPTCGTPRVYTIYKYEWVGM